MRRLYILVVLVLFLGGYALAAQRMETVLAEGKTVLLALAPRSGFGKLDRELRWT